MDRRTELLKLLAAAHPSNSVVNFTITGTAELGFSLPSALSVSLTNSTDTYTYRTYSHTLGATERMAFDDGTANRMEIAAASASADWKLMYVPYSATLTYADGATATKKPLLEQSTSVGEYSLASKDSTHGRLTDVSISCRLAFTHFGTATYYVDGLEFRVFRTEMHAWDSSTGTVVTDPDSCYLNYSTYWPTDAYKYKSGSSPSYYPVYHYPNVYDDNGNLVEAATIDQYWKDELEYPNTIYDYGLGSAMSDYQTWHKYFRDSASDTETHRQQEDPDIESSRSYFWVLAANSSGGLFINVHGLSWDSAASLLCVNIETED